MQFSHLLKRKIAIRCAYVVGDGSAGNPYEHRAAVKEWQAQNKLIRPRASETFPCQVVKGGKAGIIGKEGVGVFDIHRHRSRGVIGSIGGEGDWKSKRLNSSYANISYAVFLL